MRERWAARRSGWAGWRLGALCALALWALAAATVSAAPPASAPEGWTTRQADGFTLALPPTWQNFTMQQREFETLARQLSAENPGLAGLMESLVRDRAWQSYDLFAVDGAAAGFATNINVRSVALPGRARSSDVIDAVLPELPGLIPGLTIVTATAGLTIGGHDTGMAHYAFPLAGPGGEVRTVFGVQYYILTPGRGYIVTVSGPQTPEFIALAEQIAFTFATA